MPQKWAEKNRCSPPFVYLSVTKIRTFLKILNSAKRLIVVQEPSPTDVGIQQSTNAGKWLLRLQRPTGIAFFQKHRSSSIASLRKWWSNHSTSLSDPRWKEITVFEWWGKKQPSSDVWRATVQSLSTRQWPPTGAEQFSPVVSSGSRDVSPWRSAAEEHAWGWRWWVFWSTISSDLDQKQSRLTRALWTIRSHRTRDVSYWRNQREHTQPKWTVVLRSWWLS